MANIVGGVTSINNPRTNWNQNDAKKADFLKNKPSVANALKGHKSGASISADDVSPIEHELDVKVSGKNLFKMPDEIIPDNNIVKITDNSIVITNTTGNSWTNTRKTLKELCPSLKVGDTAILTFDTNCTIKYIYLAQEGKSWVSGKSYTITASSLLSHVVLYCAAASGAVTTINNIQLEKGTVATDYTPYVDVEGVTVKRYGKNFFSNDVSEIKQVNWVGSDGKERKYFGYEIHLPVGMYRLHARRKPEAGEGKAFIYGYIIHKDGSGTGVGSYAPVAGDSYTDVTVSITDGDRIYLYNSTGGDLDAAVAVFNAYNIQIELGDKTTEFEPYDMVEAVVDAEGNAEGLISHAPNMILISDNTKAVIDCTYNRDANKVIADLETKLNALIATIGG